MSASRFSPYQFVTLRTFGRAPLLAQASMKKLLLNSFMETKKRFKLAVAGYVVLDDHAHFLFNLPAEYEYSAVMNDLRAGFQRAWRKSTPLLERDAPNITPFWEHAIEYRGANSTDDLRAYLDFIHYDPVRHGLITRAAEYPWSSLPARIAQGHYPETWAEIGPPAAISRVARACAPSENKR
ncbi:MAG: transposase [Pseudomonadota bacterium]|nr:transposase [Pseudomonadota bacterium]